MSRMTILGALLCVLFISPVQATSINVFINELHYDNSGSDTAEGVEIAGPAGWGLDGWQLVFYNGMTQSPYKTESLSGNFADLSNGFGVLAFEIAGIQNGAPDGLALVTPEKLIAQFISYEGVINAVSGPAEGLISSDIGISESPGTAAGQSLYLAGSGSEFGDFEWVSGAASFGDINSGQEFQSQVSVVPAPGSISLIALPLGLLGWLTHERTLLRKRPV